MVHAHAFAVTYGTSLSMTQWSRIFLVFVRSGKVAKWRVLNKWVLILDVTSFSLKGEGKMSRAYRVSFDYVVNC